MSIKKKLPCAVVHKGYFYSSAVGKESVTLKRSPSIIIESLPPIIPSSQLESLTIIAYYQPATKAMVEQIRGVDSSYSISALINKKLIEEAGRLNVPGRPIQYKTTDAFLRTFGLSSLEELPPIDKISFGEPIADEKEEA